MKKYCKKSVIVEGRQITESELVTTAHGRVRAEAGDWILIDPNTGDTWPVKLDIFKATYDEIDEDDLLKCEGCLEEVTDLHKGRTWDGEGHALCAKCLVATIDDMTEYLWEFSDALEADKIKIIVEGDFDLHGWLSRLQCSDFVGFKDDKPRLNTTKEATP